MRSITQKQALKTYAELAKDIKYTQSMKTGWKPPLKIRRMSEAEHQVRGRGGARHGMGAWRQQAGKCGDGGVRDRRGVSEQAGRACWPACGISSGAHFGFWQGLLCAEAAGHPLLARPTPPRSAPHAQAVRDQFHIICEGHHIPPAITNFHDMKFPKPILDELDGKGITKPTPIQARRCRSAARARGAAILAPLVGSSTGRDGSSHLSPWQNPLASPPAAPCCRCRGCR